MFKYAVCAQSIVFIPTAELSVYIYIYIHIMIYLYIYAARTSCSGVHAVGASC